ncbi:MAG: carboxyltransferase domain-containing protein [Solirubrobacterales bacterium]|nr:carboxyltransferase domain-containing protein [Solirubrobacterales bacterium]
MSAAASPILDRSDPVGGHPAVTYRQAGDRSVLVEYGEMELDLTLNFFVLAVDAALSRQPADGLLESAPGFRSMLVRYDPSVLATHELVAHLSQLHESLPAEQEIEIPSRVIELPIAFDDSKSQSAVERYIRSIRKDAPNCEGANNIDYIVRYNGFAEREEFYDAVLATEHWTGFIGFFPGLPFMFPIDPRHTVVAPKYNPTRTWTAEGAVGLGGPCYAIYPVESAGGYQLFGRSLPVYDLQARNEVFREHPLLLRPGDRVTFERVSEEELLSTWEDARADRYRYRIEEQPFDVGAYLELREKVRDEAEKWRQRREEAAANTPVP